MPNKFISIQEAADLSFKSVQTIRRAVKSKKLKHRRHKTPQGFNYLVNFESLCSIYNINLDQPEDVSELQDIPTEGLAEETIEVPVVEEKATPDEGVYVTNDAFMNLTKSLEKMINQHSEERQNFIRLVDTLQEKIFVLENQLNLLQEPAKKWYQVWK